MSIGFWYTHHNFLEKRKYLIFIVCVMEIICSMYSVHITTSPYTIITQRMHVTYNFRNWAKIKCFIVFAFMNEWEMQLINEMLHNIQSKEHKHTHCVPKWNWNWNQKREKMKNEILSNRFAVVVAQCSETVPSSDVRLHAKWKKYTE